MWKSSWSDSRTTSTGSFRCGRAATSLSPFLIRVSSRTGQVTLVRKLILFTSICDLILMVTTSNVLADGLTDKPTALRFSSALSSPRQTLRYLNYYPSVHLRQPLTPDLKQTIHPFLTEEHGLRIVAVNFHPSFKPPNCTLEVSAGWCPPEKHLLQKSKEALVSRAFCEPSASQLHLKLCPWRTWTESEPNTHRKLVSIYFQRHKASFLSRCAGTERPPHTFLGSKVMTTKLFLILLE